MYRFWRSLVDAEMSFWRMSRVAEKAQKHIAKVYGLYNDVGIYVYRNTVLTIS